MVSDIAPGERLFGERYLKLNQSFGDPLVFLPRRGNFSDFNVLISTSVYALLNQRRLLLSNAYLQRFCGALWNDFFEASLETAEDCKIRVRAESCWPKGGNGLQTSRDFISRIMTHGEVVVSEGMEYKGDAFTLIRSLARFIVRPREDVRSQAGAILRANDVDPGGFSAVHIRRGDKLGGRTAPAGAIYVDALLPIDRNLKSLFVMTDDFRALWEVKMRLPNAHVFTNAQPSSVGFDSNAHVSLTNDAKQSELRRLLAEVLVAKSANSFVGWYQSNVSNFIALASDAPDSCRDAFRPQKRWYVC